MKPQPRYGFDILSLFECVLYILNRGSAGNPWLQHGTKAWN